MNIKYSGYELWRDNFTKKKSVIFHHPQNCSSLNPLGRSIILNKLHLKMLIFNSQTSFKFVDFMMWHERNSPKDVFIQSQTQFVNINNKSNEAYQIAIKYTIFMQTKSCPTAYVLHSEYQMIKNLVQQ